MNIKAKKKYTLKDQCDDLERLELLLVSLEAPIDYKKIYTKVFINNNIRSGTEILNERVPERLSALPSAKDNSNDDDNKENYYYDINKGNLIWLNHNLSILNKRNIKLIETLKLIQRILKKI